MNNDFAHFGDICEEANAVSIFECDIIFLGLYGFKPHESVIITSKAVQLVVNERLKFIIPMEHVMSVDVDFFSIKNSLIIISLTAQYATYIETTFKATEKIDLLIGHKNCISARITLVCENLEANTKAVLRTLLPRLSDVDTEIAAKILRNLRNQSSNNATATTTEPTICALNELKACSLKVPPAANGESTLLPAFVDGATPKKRRKSAAANESDELPPEPCDDNRILLTYNYGNGAISLSVGDYMCLTSKEFLNDRIIDFYLKYIELNFMSDEHRKRTHIFSSLFYSVLISNSRLKDKTDKRSVAQQRHDRVKNWTKNVNIFEKDFLIVPVNERLHWFVIVICYANRLLPVDVSNLHKNNENGSAVDDIMKQPVILIFNSMADTINYSQSTILRDYLTCEYITRMPANAQPPNFTKATLPGHRVKVPQQRNLYDCGLFVLQYVEEFFRKPIRDFRVPITQLAKWFNPMDIVRKREEIARLVQRLIDEQHAELGTSPKIKLPNIPFPTFNGELVAIKIDKIDIDADDDDDVKIIENKFENN